MISKLHDFEIFIATARCDSFTEAAAAMRLSVAAVSRAISRLETHMDCRLFNRTTRKINLTAEGQLALVEVTAGIDRLRNARQLLHEQRHTASGTLKVLLPNAFSKHYMMPDLPAFLDRYPALELDMYIEDFGGDLLAGGFEVALQFAPVPSNGYISRSLGSMDIILVASPDYLEKRGVPQSVEDLNHHQRIQLRGPTGGASFNWHLQHIVDGSMSVHQPVGQCFINSQLDAIIHAAVCGVGIAPTDLRAVERYLLTGDLKIVLPEYRVINGAEVVMLYPHRDHVPLKARVFMDFMLDTARQKMTNPDFDFNAYAA